MLTGLDILLARMKTNPEEFLTNGRPPYEGEIFGGRWSDLLDYAWRVSTEQEQEMLTEARKQFLRDDFNERVFKRLAGEENPEEELKKKVVIRTQGRYATGWADPAIMRGAIQGGFGQAQTKSQGQPVDYLESYLNTIPSESSSNADSNSGL